MCIGSYSPQLKDRLQLHLLLNPDSLWYPESLTWPHPCQPLSSPSGLLPPPAHCHTRCSFCFIPSARAFILLPCKSCSHITCSGKSPRALQPSLPLHFSRLPPWPESILLCTVFPLTLSAPISPLRLGTMSVHLQLLDTCTQAGGGCMFVSEWSAYTTVQLNLHLNPFSGQRSEWPF